MKHEGIGLSLAGAAILALALGCARGSLSDAHDRYMNIFGIPYPAQVTDKGGFLGRALLAPDAPAAWAQVYARAVEASGGAAAGAAGAGQTGVSTTNDKGGFFIGNLAPGTYDIFVVSPAGKAVHRSVAIDRDAIVEDADLELAPTARVSGKVTLTGLPVATGTMVYVPGTPFSALSDQDGSYYLDVPRGTYRLRADKDGFQSFESDPLDIAGDTPLDIHLDPNPWPSGQVTAQSEDGFVVRGLTTTLNIAPVPGVSFMRVQLVAGASAMSPDLDAWIPVKPTLAITQTQDGFAQLEFEFMDQYGKSSEPVDVAFYNTSLDSSWIIMHGDIDQAVTVKSGQKVKFVSGFAVGSTSPAPAPSPPQASGSDGAAAEKLEAIPGTERTSSSSSPAGSATGWIGTFFSQPVVVEAGATLAGEAQFLGGLTLAGTKSAPVVWSGDTDGGGSAVQIKGDLRYADISNLSLSFIGQGNQATIADSTLANVQVAQDLEFKGDGNVAAATSLRIVQSRLTGGWVNQSCYSDASQGSHQAPADQQSVDLERDVLNEISIGLSCVASAGHAVQFTMQHSNDLALANGLTYFAGTGPANSLPSATDVTFTVKDDYFEQPASLYPNAAAAGWPSYFAKNLASAWSDVGPD